MVIVAIVSEIKWLVMINLFLLSYINLKYFEELLISY